MIFYVIAFLGLFYSVSFILKTGCTDPGIIPRARPDEIDYMISLGDVGESPLISAAQYLHSTQSEFIFAIAHRI